MPRAHQPRKRFGQHFLHDPSVIRRLLAAIDPRPGQRLVEIGPGPGALTVPLLQRLGNLDVIELDRDLVTALAERCLDLGELRIHPVDALRFDFRTLAGPGERLRIVGNLPYNISTPLLFRFLDAAAHIRDMTLMLQREVVERMAASPGTRTYGRLTVMLAARCRVEKLFLVRAGAFSPPPKVESAVVRVVPYAKPPFDPGDWSLFERIVRAGFTARRKTLRNALRGLADASTIEAAGLDPRARPDTLSPADYAQLSSHLARSP